MSDTVWIVLIISVAVVVVLVYYRDRLKEFMIKVNEEGLVATLKSTVNGKSASPKPQPQNGPAAQPAPAAPNGQDAPDSGIEILDPWQVKDQPNPVGKVESVTVKAPPPNGKAR